jgi:hypothetical protein
MSGHYPFVPGHTRRFCQYTPAVARPATGKTPKRSIRVPDDKWEAVKAKALAEGKTASDVINECLDAYLTGKADAPTGRLLGHHR